MRKAVILTSVILSLVLVAGLAFAGSVVKSSGQTVYVSASFFEIVSPTNPDSWVMVTRMVIRNTDPENAITINSVKYYSQNGEELYDYLNDEQPTPNGPIDPIGPITIDPFCSKSFKTSSVLFDPHPVNEGRPFFLVEWEAGKRVIAPIIGAGIATVNPGTGEVTSLLSTGSYVIKDKYH